MYKLFENSCNEHLEGFNENFELNDQNSRAQWLEELENFRQSKECPKDVRQLAVCSFILKYYDTPELDKIISDIKLVSDASKYTYFPEKLDDRWSKDGISGFGIHETVFVFISHLDCYIDSPTLKRLGCTLIDCPGLFNNKYDTDVTTQIMSKVHAILYLLPYEKRIGEDVCKSLYKIQSDFRDVHRKLFIANNLSSKKDNLFLEDNINEVKRLFGEDKHVTCYDAHLAYLGMFKQSLEAGLLKPDDVTHFCRPVTRLTITRTIQTIKFADFEDAWKYHTRGYDVEIDSDEFIKASQINQLIDDLRSFIEANKAYTVIFSDGINKMHGGLTEVRNVLYSKFVEPYCLGSEELIRLWQERIAKAKEFDKKAEDIIKKHLFATRNNIDALSSRLSDDVYRKLFTESIYDEISKRIAATIYENKYTVFKLLRKEENLKKFISPLIEEDIASFVESRLNYWNSIMSNGSDTSFKDIFEPEMELLEGKLLREWEQTYSTDEKFFKRMNEFLSIPRNSAGFAIKCTEKQSASVSIKAKDIMPELLAEVAVIASGIAMAVASYICFLISSVIAGGGVLATNPVGVLIAMLGLGAGAGLLLAKGPDAIKNEFVKDMSKKIRSELNKQGIASKFKKMITSEINRRLESFGEKLHVDFEKLDNERDIATSISDEVKEDACFTSLQIIANINSQLKLYKCFKDKHVEHDKA
ncbi:MAG: dynamin family protein [Solobacterium sp.]|nr:dynamin family protein [Solobacterium sp.]